ncbi:flagellar motor switch protein FliG [Geothermobacter ehrlichii]|uniref:Flagellar motor switch protein FliG n=1 Tax=Geothermobacter ehrlichii TaxID=213224 RepID=A0A5D3WNR4_9BACT|nr:flagellar motor switch protein FliG [Geothermobacter ehrlichii]TYP00212.1 flagellar motor switch protein FliG [Geothermobacter ehrlichii]
MITDKSFAKLTGVEKAAILLLCLGEETTTRVFEELPDDDVRILSRCMMNISHVPANLAKDVIEAFKKDSSEYTGLFVQGREFVRKAISSAGDPERASSLIEQVENTTDERPLETISLMQPRMVASLLQAEHPQTVALILSTQKPEHASRIISFLPEEMRADIMYRIANIDKVSHEVIAQIEEALQREIGVVTGNEQQTVGGVDKAVEILARLEGGLDKDILDAIDETDSELAEEIKRRMFTFEDLAELDNRALQTILREVNNDQLTMALKSCSDSVKEKIFSNISERAAAMIEEDLEAMGPVRLSEVEAMQQAIVEIALKLEEEGQIVIAGRGGGDVLV